MKKMSSEPRRPVKGGQKKRSISGHQQQREKEAAGAEMGVGESNIPALQISHQKATEDEIGEIATNARNTQLYFAANGRL